MQTASRTSPSARPGIAAIRRQVGRVEIRSGRSWQSLAELFGDEADSWFGWHIRRAPDPDGRGPPALLISSLRHPVDGKVAVGVVDVYVLRARRTRGDQGTITAIRAERHQVDAQRGSFLPGERHECLASGGPSPSWPAIA
jgi:hypothetical protein